LLNDDVLNCLKIRYKSNPYQNPYPKSIFHVDEIESIPSLHHQTTSFSTESVDPGPVPRFWIPLQEDFNIES
jgi:hypothetical protein